MKEASEESRPSPDNSVTPHTKRRISVLLSISGRKNKREEVESCRIVAVAKIRWMKTGLRAIFFSLRVASARNAKVPRREKRESPAPLPPRRGDEHTAFLICHPGTKLSPMRYDPTIRYHRTSRTRKGGTLATNTHSHL